MILTFAPLKQRPPEWSRPRVQSPFRATYSDTLELLERELGHLKARTPILQVEARPGTVRMDGQLRANARVTFPGVILSFATKKFGTLSYPCCAFADSWKVPGWQSNLRAIALGLGALRKVERYGIAERGQQYAGWAELPSGIPMAAPKMTVTEAARFIVECTGVPDWLADVEADPFFALSLYKDAAKVVHPDTGGDDEKFKRLVAAKECLEAES